MSPSARRRTSSNNALLIAAAAAAWLPAQARAVDIVLDNESIEIQHRSSTGAWATSQAQPWLGMRIGTQSGFGGPDSGNGLGGIEAIMFFKLPAIPAGQSLSSASLAFSELKEGSTGTPGTVPAFNVDLYALGFDKNSPPDNDGAASGFGTGGVTSGTVAPAYFYIGPDQAPTTITAVNPNNVASAKIQEDVLTPADWNAALAAPDGQVPHTTSAAGNTALLNYINSLYSNPNFTPDHDYLILRMNPDVAPVNTQTHRYQIPFAQTATFNDGTHTPTSTDCIAPTLSLSFSTARLAGDVNGDGFVNSGDINAFIFALSHDAAGFAAQYPTGNYGNADVNGDSHAGDTFVNAADINPFIQILSGTGEPGITAALAAVPEPTSLAACGLALLPLLSRRRRRA